MFSIWYSSLIRAATTGIMDFIYTSEFTLKTSELQELASKEIFSKEETPLILASMNGHLNVVRYLVEEARVNINQLGKIKSNKVFPPFIGSALHAAVIDDQLHVVNYLVDCCRINIDLTTKQFDQSILVGGSTALHVSTNYRRGLPFGVQRKIISYLLEHGADWTIADNTGKQFWEYMTWSVTLTEVLVEFGVGLDPSQNAKLSTFAHLWATPSSWFSKTVMYAIDKGLDINAPNIEGLTPLMIAALGRYRQPNIEFVSLILEQKVQPISRLDQIITLELVGTTYISGKNFVDGILNLKRAMELRFNAETEPPIPKPPITLTDDVKSVLKCTNEVQTMEELENIALNLVLLGEQGFLIRLRILGLKHIETMRYLAYHAIFVWSVEPQTFLNYLNIILQEFDFEPSKKSFWIDYCSKLLALSLIAITRSSEDIPVYENSTFNNGMLILRKLVNLLHNDNESNSYIVDCTLQTIVDLAYILLHNKPLTLHESFDLKYWLYQAVRLQKRNSKGLDLFLLACSSSEFTVGRVLQVGQFNDYNSISFRRPVSAQTISIFIEVGVDIDSVSNEGDTGFHILAKNIQSDANTPCIRTLYEAGVHVDQINFQGKTMTDILNDREIHLEKSIINACHLQPPLLTCLCARLARQLKIPLTEISSDLAKFVKRH